MAKSANQKLKILILARMFEEETDEHSGISMGEIIAYLAEYGIAAERKSIYRDIDALREFGMDIQTRHNPHVEYYLATRSFSLSELMLITDAVQSSRFLTSKQSNQLANRLQTLLSKQQRWWLEGDVHVKGRIKKPEDSAFMTVDTIRAALTNRRKVEFSYLEYDAAGRKRLRKEGRTYVQTPVSLIYANNAYYLITYNEKYEDFNTYRVDRMANVRVSPESGIRNRVIANFDAMRHIDRSFNMYAGEEVSASFLVKIDAMSSVMDRFFTTDSSEVSLSGASVSKLDEEHAIVHARIMESPVFYGWLAQFGENVTVRSPRSLVERYRSYLLDILGSYEQGASEGAEEGR